MELLFYNNILNLVFPTIVYADILILYLINLTVNSLLCNFDYQLLSSVHQ